MCVLKFIIENVSPKIAEDLCRNITKDLSEYFGLPEINEHYAIGVRSCINIAAKIDRESLISIDFPYPNNANIYWIGVMKNFDKRYRKKISRRCIAAC